MAHVPTGWQTVGPYLHIGLQWLDTTALAQAATRGQRITIRGRVLDGDGLPVPDAMIEIWQADAEGHYAHPEDREAGAADPAFFGFGRCPTNAQGEFSFATIKPGAVPGPGNTLQAPHILVGVFMRGLLKRLVTRIYFADEARNAEDPVLNLVEDAPRRKTLMAVPEPGAQGVYRWDVRMQGDQETVFFEL